MEELKQSIDRLNKTIIHVVFILITFLTEMYLIDLYGGSKIVFSGLSILFVWIMNVIILHILHNKK